MIKKINTLYKHTIIVKLSLTRHFLSTPMVRRVRTTDLLHLSIMFSPNKLKMKNKCKLHFQNTVEPVLTVTSDRRSPPIGGHFVTPRTSFLLFYLFIKRSTLIRGHQNCLPNAFFWSHKRPLFSCLIGSINRHCVACLCAWLAINRLTMHVEYACE